MRREHYLMMIAAAAAVLLVLGATSPALKARASAQLDLAAGSGDSGPVTISDGADKPVSHGITPAKWEPHIPRYGHTGPHAMYHHPRVCSPCLTAPQQIAYDWRFSPPAQGDL